MNNNRGSELVTEIYWRPEFNTSGKKEIEGYGIRISHLDTTEFARYDFKNRQQIYELIGELFLLLGDKIRR